MRIDEFVKLVIATDYEDIEIINVEFEQQDDLNILDVLLNSNISNDRMEKAFDAIIGGLDEYNYFNKPLKKMLPNNIVKELIDRKISLIALGHLDLEVGFLNEIISILGEHIEASSKIKKYANDDIQ